MPFAIGLCVYHHPLIYDWVRVEVGEALGERGDPSCGYFDPAKLGRWSSRLLPIRSPTSGSREGLQHSMMPLQCSYMH